ncbi:MAG TPA: hypothetical protein VNK49_12395 [Anaerolineales bacterium]|nr:hypothetical protein [Anaerolineales bacterium]
MRLIQAPRASTILYSLLKSREDQRPWLLPANICPVVPLTFLKANIPFEFVDISAETLHMDLDQAAALIRTRRFGGLLYAHTYGDPFTPGEFFWQMKQWDETLLIVDDRCLCVPDVQPDSANPADVLLYSTGYGKVVELGLGGYAFLRDGVNYQSVHLNFDPRHEEQIEYDYKRAIRGQYRFEYKDCHWLQTDAALPDWDAYRLKIENARREAIALKNRLNEMYAQCLPPEIQLPARYQMWRFNIRVREQSRILKAVFEKGLFASSYYASLAGIMGEGYCPNAEALAREIINLFNNHHFDEERVKRTCEVILENIG